MNVNLIVAVDRHNLGIGYKGTIPWKNKNDMKWFKEVTIGDGNNAVVMGHTTYNSIGKPLPNRINIVLSHSDLNIDGCLTAKSLNEAIDLAKEAKVDSLFIIGGGLLYIEAMTNNYVDIIYMDLIDNGDANYTYDRYFNFIDTIANDYMISEALTEQYKNIPDTNITVLYRNRANGVMHDNTYLHILRDIIVNGKTKYTRAGETLSVFGRHYTFDLREGLPILTTKKVYSKGCIHELLWFLKGGTNIKYLIDNNTHIWDDDAYRYYIQKFENDKDSESRMSKEEFLNNVNEQKQIHYTDEKGLHASYTFGDLGPIYGKQWTDWNGINQVTELIEKLKTNPDDRRLMISAWNVGDLKDMALPPCHYLSQWYTTRLTHEERCFEYYKRANTVNNVNLIDVSITEEELDKANIPTYYLSCMWMQRSVDTCLGLPYDLLSYSILTHLIAHVCNMIPLEVQCSLGDTHIYKNQLDGAIKQLQRNPLKYKYPTLTLNPDIKNIYDFTYDDIKINDYKSYSTIKYPLSVGL